MKKRPSKKSEINLNKHKKSPSIFRSITEFVATLIHQEKLLLSATVLAVFFLGLVIYESMSLVKVIAIQKSVQMEREKVVYQLSFWRHVVQLHPDYKDAYFMLAVLEKRLGNTHKSREYVQKSLEIDPNFDQAKQLQQLLEER